MNFDKFRDISARIFECLGSRVEREYTCDVCVREDRRSAEIRQFYLLKYANLGKRAGHLLKIRGQLFAQCFLAYSQTLYFLFKVRQAHVVKKIKTAGDLLTASARG